MSLAADSARPSRLDRATRKKLADMHREILPDSLVSRLGAKFAEQFYQYVEESDREFVFVEQDGDTLLSACIVSAEPQSLQKRLLLKTPLLAHVPFAIRRLPIVSMARGMLERKKPAISQDPGPEVLLIFTTEAARGRGLGAEMLRRTEAYLRETGHDVCHVKTVDSPSNRAIAFYLREGFEKRGVVEKNGKRLVLFSKPL